MITLSLTFPSLSLSSSQPLSSIATRSPSCFSLYIFKTNHYKPKPHPPSSSSSSSSFVNSNKTNKDDEFLLDDELISRVSASRDADVAMETIVAEIGGGGGGGGGGVVSGSDCCLIISKAFESGNVGLALSVGNAMRSSFGSGASGDGMVSSVQRWRWSRPDVDTYTILVLGLAASLRVSDALKMIGAVSRVGVSPGEEVPFGQIVRCPTCLIAVAVAQPQHGIQIVSCSKCRYQYELVSGDITSIESEEISMEAPAWKRGLSFVLRRRQNLPAAVHSIVVNTPSGTSRTHRFATETVDLPAQEGERVTIAVAATSNMYRQVGPLKISPKSPNFYPGEPIFLTNHINGRESLLLRAPIKNENSSLLNPSIIIPLVAVLATGDAASGMIDPSLPQLISVAAFSTLAIGATFKSLVVPQLARLPQKSVDAIAIRQQLLSQYDQLQSRIKDLKEAAQNEVWMLARMCQLENKIFAVGEPSYRARKSRVRKVRENLEGSLKKRIELIDSYAKISSMIEIEVEMDSDVLGAEAASNAESIADQIQQTMELENLEERWKIQIEANDEVERLLRSELTSSEQVMDV